MNRRSSTDSLDNGNIGIAGSASSSSSPIDFTSDDEGNLDNQNPISLTNVYYKHRLSRRDLRNLLRDLDAPKTVRFQDGPEGFMVANQQVNWEHSLVDDMPLVENNQEPSSMDRAIASFGRAKNGEILRMNAKLVECRSIAETYEFVNQNRDTIDNLTRIITHEAPSYRNYDMSEYQVDHSVKESFNPNFWLDREPIVTTADGNCQYHAISLSLTGTEAYTPQVRLATAVAVVDNIDWFDNMLKLIDRGSVLDLIHTIARSHSWGDETTLKAVAIAIKRRIFLYTCNLGKKDYEVVKSLSREELLEAFRDRKYRGGTGIHAYADPLTPVSANNYIMLFHKSEHFIAILPTGHQPVMYEPYIPIVPTFT